MLLTRTSHYCTPPNKVTFRATSSLCLLSAGILVNATTATHKKQIDFDLDLCNPEAKHGDDEHIAVLRT